MTIKEYQRGDEVKLSDEKHTEVIHGGLDRHGIFILPSPCSVPGFSFSSKPPVCKSWVTSMLAVNDVRIHWQFPTILWNHDQRENVRLVQQVPLISYDGLTNFNHCSKLMVVAGSCFLYKMWFHEFMSSQEVALVVRSYCSSFPVSQHIHPIDLVLLAVGSVWRIDTGCFSFSLQCLVSCLCHLDDLL